MGKSKNVIKPLYVGDLVTWSSQAGGHAKKKTGTVVEVVPPRRCPKVVSSTSFRAHESYVVEVTYQAKQSRGAIKSLRMKKPERYWPLVANLRVVRRGAPAGVVSRETGLPPVPRPHPTGVTDPAGTTDPGVNGYDPSPVADPADASSVEAGAN